MVIHILYLGDYIWQALDNRYANSSVSDTMWMQCVDETGLIGQMHTLNADDPWFQYDENKFSSMPSIITFMLAALETSLSFLDCMLLSARLLEGLDVLSDPEDIDVRGTIDSAIACCQLCYSPTQNIQVSCTVADNVANYITSDKQCILRNLMNLLNNACQHTLEGSIHVICELCESNNNVAVPGASLPLLTGVPS